MEGPKAGGPESSKNGGWKAGGLESSKTGGRLEGWRAGELESSKTGGWRAEGLEGCRRLEGWIIFRMFKVGRPRVNAVRPSANDLFELFKCPGV